MRPKAVHGFMAILSVALALSMAGCFTDDIKMLAVSDISPTEVRDGTYEGEQDNIPITAKVEVVVKSGTIAAIKVLEQSHGPGHSADAIIGRVISAQSLKVDAVTGASLSSKVMLKALETALEKGVKK
jgi:uncharacterized protein with FMN-binding domain